MSPMWKMESTFPEFTSSVRAPITERDPGYEYHKSKNMVVSV
jgi:hypothetical protein